MVWIVLQEEHFNVITYEVAAEHLNLPRVFSLLGTHKAKLGIVDYSVSQKTLEMVSNYKSQS